MTLVDAQPAAPADAERAGDAPSVPAPEAPAAARTCRVCSAPMAPAQDWCLECGTAAPGRLGGRPGWRAASTVAGLTLMLVLGAVAASYAALSGERSQVATQASVPATAPIVTPLPGAPPVTQEPVPTTETPAEELPEVDVPSSTGGELPDPVDVAPPEDTTAVTPTPGFGDDTGSADDGTTDFGTDTDTGTDAGTTAEDEEPVGPAALELDEDAARLYDPYGNVVESNGPARALDGSPSTSFLGRAADGASTMAFGLVIALDDPADVREVVLQTKTPGFRVEVYGTTGRRLPRDVLDDRWIHIRDRADVDAAVDGAPKDGNVDGDGEERIDLGDKAEGKDLRRVLLWFTLPPENGPAVRLTEVELRA